MSLTRIQEKLSEIEGYMASTTYRDSFFKNLTYDDSGSVAKLVSDSVLTEGVQRSICCATLDDVRLIRNINETLSLLVSLLHKYTDQQDVLNLRSSDEFKRIVQINDFAQPAPWKAVHSDNYEKLPADAAIETPGEEIYVSVSNTEMDFIAQARNDLSLLVSFMKEGA